MLLSLFIAFTVTGVALAANNGQLSGSGSISGESVVGGSISFDISVVNDPPGVGVFYQDRLYNITGVVDLPPNLSLNSCSITPTEILKDTPSAGYTQIRFENIKNLEVNESVALSCTATLAPTIQIGDTFSIDYRWEAYTNPCEECTGEWRYFPGPTPGDFAPITAKAQAFDLEKSSSTTTGEAQVNGAGGYEPTPAQGHGLGPDWPYTYHLSLTNNPLHPVDQAKIFDIVPPGVAYLGNDTITCSQHGAPATTTPTRTLSDGSIPDTVDGSLVLEWDLDTVFASTITLGAGEVCQVTYQTAIPYRERRFADGVTVSGGPFTGPIVGSPDASHQNNYYATGNYEDPVNGPIPQIDGSTPGATPGDDAPVSVHSSYHSITKSSNVSTVFQDTAVDYSVTGYISEYYDFTASPSTPYVITDVIPDGLEFCSTIPPGDTNGFYNECPFVATSALFDGAPLNPVSVTPVGGDLVVTWNVTDSSKVQAGDTWTLAYKAVVRDFYTNGLPVSGLDVRPNNVTASGTWNDLVTPGRTGTDTTHATTSIRVGSPSIDKTTWDPITSQWVQGPVTLEIGQPIQYKLALSFDDDLDMRNVIIDDPMPMGQHYIPNSADFTGSQGYTDTTPPNTPQTAQGQYNGTTYEVEQAQNLGNFLIDFCPYNDTLGRVDGNPADPFLTVLDVLGGRQRLQWFLCRIDNSDRGSNIIWQTQFHGVVVDDSQVYNGCQVNNFGHLSGTNSFGKTYSLRDNLTAIYAVPNLVMRKTNTAPDPLTASGPFNYTLSVENDGGVGTVGSAYDWTIKDIIPAGLRVPASGGVCSSFSTDAPGRFSCVPDAGAQAGTGGFVTIMPVDISGAQDPTRTVPPSTTYNFNFQAEMTDTSPGAATADEKLTNTASVEYCTQPMPLDLDHDGRTDRRCVGYLANTLPHSDAGGAPTFNDFRDYVETDDTAPNGPNETDNTDTSQVHIGAVATTKTHIAPVHTAPQVTGDFATIGEVYQVTLGVNIPARTILYSDPTAGNRVDAVDTIAGEGVSFCDAADGIAGCQNPVITQAGTTAAPDTTHGPLAPNWWQVDATSPYPGSSVHFFLQKLDNSAGTADYPFTITFTVVVTGKDDYAKAAFFPPTTNDLVSNSFVLSYFNDDQTPLAFTTPPVSDQIAIDQPHITTDKEATSIIRPGIGALCNSAATCNSVQVQGSDLVTYGMTYLSDGESTAFDVSMVDDLTVYATYNGDMVCTSDTATPVSGGVVSSSPAAAPYTTELQIDTTPAGRWDLPPSKKVSCSYSITVDPTVPAGTTLANFTDADWSTLDGTPIAPDSERIFDDSDVNGDSIANDDGTRDQDVESLQVTIPVAGKTRLAPGPTGPGTQPPVRIGDVVDYQITIPLPIGRTQNLVITDLPDPGLIYYEGGVLTVRTNTLNPLAYTQTLNGTNDGVGAFSVSWAVSDPLCAPVAGASSCIYNDGVNNTAVTIDLQMIVADVPLNKNGLVLDNLMSAAFMDGLGKARSITDGGPLNDQGVVITEPHITTTKTAAPVTSDAGDTVAYTVKMTNDGAATAYDVSFDENLDDHTHFDTSTPITCTDSASGPVTFQLDISPFDGANDAPAAAMDVFRVAGNLDQNSNNWDLTPGESITCIYKVILLDTVTPGYTVKNLVDADWSSLNGIVSGGPTSPNERIYDDRDRNPLVDTNGNGNLTDDDDDAIGFPLHTGIDDQAASIVTVPAPVIAKSRTSAATVQPGQLVSYQIVITIPEGTTSGLSITDTLPLPANAFRFESGSAPVAGWGGPLPALSAQPAIGNSGVLTWTFSGPVSNPGNNTADNTITLNYTVRVYSNATTGVNTNTARASYTNPAGGTSQSNASTATVTVVRPNIAVTKTASAASADSGDAITYTVTVTNSGPAGSLAYDVYFDENLSNNTDYDTSLGMTCTQNGSPTTFEMDDLSDGADTTPDAFSTGLDQFRIAGSLAENSNPWVLASGQSLVCIYRVIALDTVGAGGSGANGIRNSVTGNLDSADGDQLGEQNFSLSATRTLTIPAPTYPSKTRTSASNTAQPGDLVSYRVTIGLPEGTTSGLRIVDTIPAGFQFVSTDAMTADWTVANPSFTLPTFTAPLAGATGPLTWTFGSGVVNPGDNNAANNTITLTYTVRVTNTAASTTVPLGNGSDAVNSAQVFYTPPGGASTSIATHTAAVDVIRPTLAVTKTVSPAAPNKVDAGDILTYTVKVSNSGPGTAYDLYFDENLDDNTDYVIPSTLTCTHSAGGPLTYQVDLSPFDGMPDAAITSMDQFRIAGSLDENSNPWALAPGQTITCSYQVVVNQDAPATGLISNAVTAHGDTADGDTPGEDNLSASSSTALVTPDVSMVKDNDTTSASYHADDTYAPGDLVPYVLTITAPEGAIRNLVVCDNMAAQMGYDGTTSIANSDGMVYTLGSQYTILTAGFPAACPAGTDVAFVFVNPLVLDNVANANNATPAGDFKTITIRYLGHVLSTATNSQTLTNTATLAYSRGDTGATQTSVDTETIKTSVVTQATDKAITTIHRGSVDLCTSAATCNPIEVNAGDVLTYSLSLTNTHATATAYEVTLSDSLPAGLRYNGDLTCSRNPGGPISTTPPAAGSNPVLVDAAAIGTINLTPGQSLACTYTATVQPGVPAGTGLTNTVTGTVTTASGTPPGDKTITDTGTDTATTAAIDLQLGKSVDKPQANAGDTVVFTLTLNNLGPSPATGVTVKDLLPAGFTFVSANPSGVYDSATGLWTVGGLAVNGSTQLRITATITATGPYTNYAQVLTADQPDVDSTPGDNSTIQDDDDSASVDILPKLDVTKTVSPTSLPEAGGAVTFTVGVTNTSAEPETLTSLIDNIYGNLNGLGTCVTPQTLAASATYSCTFPETIPATPGVTHIDIITATVRDAQSNTATDTASASVTVIDVLPSLVVQKQASATTIDEPGGNITFTISVHNTSAEDDILSVLTDDVYGNLNGVGTCATGGTILAGSTYTCSFTKPVSGPGGTVHTDTVTGTLKDDENNSATDTDSATVTILDVIQVVKTANPVTVPEPGAPVDFTVQVHNTSAAPVTLTSLVDDVFGDLNGQGDCVTGGTIAAGAAYTCTFQKTISGNAAFTHHDTVTATVTDSGQQATDTDDATVTVGDVLPTISVSKSPVPGSLNEPGGNVDFTVMVTNTSPEPVTLTALTDDVYGDLNGKGDCATGGTIAVGAAYTCTFTGPVSGDAGQTHTDTVTATAHDDENNKVTGKASANVSILDVKPTMTVAKSASVTTINEPGGNVDFTVVVTNTSPESITLTALTDDVYGDLNGKGSCATPQTVAVAAAYTCTFTGPVSSDAGDVHTDTVTATAQDNETNTVTGDDDATVTILDVLPTLDVVKSANPASIPEPGGDITFNVDVTNTSPEPVTLVSLIDDVYGNLNGQGDCAKDGTIAAGATYSCSFTKTVSGDAGDVHTDTITASIRDNENHTVSGSDDATVTIGDVKTISIDVVKSAGPTSIPEPGGTVTFHVDVTNHSIEDVKLLTLVDDTYGDLDGQGDCSTGGTIKSGDTYSCSFDETVSGNAGSTHTDTVTATAEDDEHNQGNDTDSATVTITDVLPALTVTKAANPTAVNEPGGDVTYTIVVTNDSVEPVKLTSLVDDRFGNLDGQGTCATPQDIAVGAAYTCTFTKTISGNAGDLHTNTVTAKGRDDENNSASDTDSATVTIQDVPPTIAVSKTPSVGSLPEPGGTVTFMVVVQNTSAAEPLTLTTLTDNVFGNLDTQGTCAVPQTIIIGGGYSCTFDGNVTGNVAQPHTDTVSATATDDDHGSVTQTAGATVTFGDVLPSISVSKTPGVASIDEPGGNVTYTVVVTNNSVESVRLTSLVDDKFGDLDGQGSCAAPQDIAVGAAYTCTFTGSVTGPVGSIHTNAITATAHDDENNPTTDKASAGVLIADVISVSKSPSPASMPEPGGNVDFTVVVTNLTASPITLNALNDNVFGDLNGQGTCSVPQTIAAGGNYNCDFTQPVTGKPGTPHTDTVTASVTDSLGGTATDSDSATVTFTDVLPQIEVTKTAAPMALFEPGGSVTFGVAVKNDSVEPVTLDTLTDDHFGDLNGQGTCATGGVIAVGGTYTCSFIHALAGSAGDVHTDTISATVSDDENNHVTQTGSVDVTFKATADLELTKTVSDTAPDMGSTVTFTLTLVNHGPSDATGVTVTDLLTAGYTYSSSTPSQGSYDDTTGLWTVGTLNNGQTAMLTIDAVVGPSGPYDNYAEVTHSDQHDSDSTPGNGSIGEDDDDTVAVTPVAGCVSGELYLDQNQNGVRDSSEIALPGVHLNLYKGGTLIAQVVTDSNGQYTFPVVPTGSYTVEIDQATLPPGIPIFITPGNPRQVVKVTVGGTCAIGDYGLLITDPVITKRGSPSQANRGDLVSFTVQVTNSSATTAMTNVVVNDPLNAYFDYVSSTMSQGTASYDASTHVITFDLGTLGAGATATMTIQVTVSSSAPRPSTILNQASLTYENGTDLTSPIVQVKVPASGSTDNSGGDGSSGSSSTDTTSSGPTVLPNTGERDDDAVRIGLSWLSILDLILMWLVGMLSVALFTLLLHFRGVGRKTRLVVLVVLLLGVITASIVFSLNVLRPSPIEVPPLKEAAHTAVPAAHPAPAARPTVPPPVAGAATEAATSEAAAPVAPIQLANRLLIPSIKVDASIATAPVVGQTWDMSALRQEVGYLEGTAYPGGPGNAVLAGHVTLKGGINGPFVRLRELSSGDVVVAEDDTTAFVYRVEWIKEVDQTEIGVTAPTDAPSLTLITCTQWSTDLHAFTKRLIVRAALFEQHALGGDRAGN